MYGFADSEYSRMRKSMMGDTVAAVLFVIAPFATFMLFVVFSERSADNWMPIWVILIVSVFSIFFSLLFSFVGLFKAESLLKRKVEYQTQTQIRQRKILFWVVLILTLLIVLAFPLLALPIILLVGLYKICKVFLLLVKEKADFFLSLAICTNIIIFSLIFVIAFGSLGLIHSVIS